MSELERCCFVLGVSADASADEMKRAYRDLVREWHPDRLQHDARLCEQAEARLKEINVAYARLKALRASSSTGAKSATSPAAEPSASAWAGAANPREAYARAAGYAGEREPDTGRAEELFREGMAEFEAAHWKEAVSALLQSVCLKQHNADAYFALGRAYLELKMPAKAAAAFKQVIRMRPGFEAAHEILARTCIAMGEYRDAAWVCNQYLRRHPGAWVIQTVMGAAYRLWNRLPQAREALEAVIRARPDLAEAHYEMGRTLLSLGDKEAARLTLKTLRSLDRDLAAELFISISTSA